MVMEILKAIHELAIHIKDHAQVINEYVDKIKEQIK